MSTPIDRSTPPTAHEPETHPNAEEPSPLWLLAFGGLVLTGLAGFVIYETLAIFAAGSAQYLECVRGSGVPLEGCGDQLDLAYAYRYGTNALQALGAALLAAFAGPLPMIVMLSRYRNNLIGAVLFFLIMFPYGLLAFLVLLLGTLVIIFYGVELT